MNLPAREAPDAAVRARALDPRGSFIVRAPAGSGKTELLTRRILVLLADAEEPEEVLAITFTKKAASEMRQRVVEALFDAGPDAAEISANAHAVEGRALARRVRERDRVLGWGLLEDPERLNLRTIDSLTRTLVTGLPLASSVGGVGETTTRPEPLYREAARRFIAARLDVLSPLLLHLRNDLERLQRLLVTLLAVRDQWLRYLPLGEMSGAALRAHLESMIEALVRARLVSLCERVPSCVPMVLLPILPRAADCLVGWATANAKPLKGWQSRVVDCRDRFASVPGSASTDLPLWSVLADMLLTAEGGLRRSVTADIGCPGRANAALLGIDRDVLIEHTGAMKEVLAALADEPAFVERLALARTLPEPVFADDDWERLELVVAHLPDLVAELARVFTETGVTDFVEVARRAAVALGTDDSAAALSSSTGVAFRHILVDEFQDTSRAQLLLLERLVFDWEPGDGRTLFVVGDPMQSIYRFREGDVSLFLHALDSGIGGIKLEPVNLTANFRSVPGIVGWVNECLGPIFPATPDPDLGAVPYELSMPFRDGRGGVDIHALECVDKAGAAQHVARLVADTLRADADGTIGILLRTRTQARELLSALRERGVGYRALEIDALDRRPVVSDLLALAFVLLYPHDRLHWLAVLRGPLGGLTLADLHALVGDDGASPVVDRLGEGVARGVSEDGCERLAQLAEVMRPAIHHASRGPLVPWIEAVWLRLGGPAACEGVGDEGAVERCLMRLAELEREGRLHERRAFTDAVERLYAPETAAPGTRVDIMTVHRAKGLEFDHVVVPGLEHRGRVDDKRLIEWHEGTIGDGAGLLLAPIDPPDALREEAGPLAALIRDTQARADAHELKRLLYVACTRARRRLHLCASIAAADAKGCRRSPSSRSLLAPLHDLFVASLDEDALSDGIPEEEPASEASLHDVARTDGVRRFVRAASGWRLPAFERFSWPAAPLVPPAAPAVDHPWRSPTARDVGTVVHRALQRLASVPAAERRVPRDGAVTRIERELRTLGVIERALDEAVGQVITAIRNTLNDERGRWVLDERHAESRSEWALTVPTRDTKGSLVGVRRVILDRTFVDDEGTRWVVDYKTGSHEGADEDAWLDEQVERYRDQLETYADVLRRLDSRPVRVGLWFPMSRAWREFSPTARPATGPTHARVV